MSQCAILWQPNAAAAHLVDSCNQAWAPAAGSHDGAAHRHHEILIGALHHCVHAPAPPCRRHLLSMPGPYPHEDTHMTCNVAPSVLYVELQCCVCGTSRAGFQGLDCTYEASRQTPGTCSGRKMRCSQAESRAGARQLAESCRLHAVRIVDHVAHIVRLTQARHLRNTATALQSTHLRTRTSAKDRRRCSELNMNNAECRDFLAAHNHCDAIT